MADSNVPQLKYGRLVQRTPDGNWYLRYTRNGKHCMKSTRCRDYADAVSQANQFFTFEERLVDDRWVKHVKECMADSKSWLRELMRKVRHRNIHHRQIKPKEIEEIAVRSGGVCELTGIPFSLENPTKSKTPPYKPSLDRIDCSIGYTPDNCRLIIVAANIALRDWGDDVFRSVCLGYASKFMNDRMDTRATSVLEQ